MAAVMGLVAAGLAIPFAGVLGIATKQAASGMTNLPEELETEPLSQRTQMVDGAGISWVSGAGVPVPGQVHCPVKQYQRVSACGASNHSVRPRSSSSGPSQ